VSLRWKVALALALVASVATVVVATASYRATRDRLLGEVDRSLADIEVALRDRRLGLDAPLPERGPLSGFDAQVVGVGGVIRQSTFPSALPVTDADLTVIGRSRASVVRTVATVDGDYRVRTFGVPRGAVQIGRPLGEVERVLDALRTRSVLLVVLVAAAAGLAGLWIAGRVTASLRRLTAAAEHVEATGQLDVPGVTTRSGADDEVGRLTAAFDRMLAALARSQDEQRRLVQDAGHELRTPLTSLRTNLDVLQRHPEMPGADRDALVADLRAETQQLTDLVNEIVAVASGAQSDEPVQPFDLAELVRDAATRAERRTGRTFAVTADPSPVTAQRSSVQRAVSCLLDNAHKFDDSGGPIEVFVSGASVTVSDRGPGIPARELDRVFDRFHRAESARALPGSGLGLSIVREVARRNGGDAFAANRDDGGASVGFRLGP
jgi:two-component system sensor histidine kinase MprB